MRFEVRDIFGYTFTIEPRLDRLLVNGCETLHVSGERLASAIYRLLLSEPGTVVHPGNVWLSWSESGDVLVKDSRTDMVLSTDEVLVLADRLSHLSIEAR